MEQTRRSWLKKIGFVFAGIGLSKFNTFASSNTDHKTKKLPDDTTLPLGAFSVSLNVKDLKASKQFYENLGFKMKGGDLKQNYVVMKNEHAIIGLFQGMFDKTILTFNPGWDENKKTPAKFEDVREIQKKLKAKGIKLTAEADEKTKGPAFITLEDPDGNQILFDQHV